MFARLTEDELSAGVAIVDSLPPETQPSELSDRYDQEKAARYQIKYSRELRARLTSIRECQILGRVLRALGYPDTVLDLPCGAGRLWPLLKKKGVRRLIGADSSKAMLELARETASAINQPVEIHRASAFGTRMPDGCAPLVICMRFYHHLAHQNDRLRVLEELKRLSSRYVVLSLWVDGNFSGDRRMRKQKPATGGSGYGGRRCRKREDAEGEFRQAGFTIVGHYDVWPKLQMTRIYLLEK